MDQLLHEQYLSALSQRLAELKTLANKYRAGDPDSEARIRMITHSLHGSGSSFGFPEISELAKAAELGPADELLTLLSALLQEIRKVLAQSRTATNPPAAPEPSSQPAQPAAVAEKTPEPSELHVLVIEDDAAYVALVREALLAVDPKFIISVTATAREAQARLVNNTYRLIILDLILPDRDGREILREIKIDFKLTTPVLILSGITKDMIRVECMSLGADKYLNKSINSTDLAGELDRLMQQSSKPALALVPKGKELNPATQQTPATAKALVNKTVLVAEDDPLQASLIQTRLSAEGLVVEIAENGRHALQLLRQKPFSLVILDVQMPMVSGFEVLEKMRTELEMPDVPVIVLSAMGSEQDIIKGYDLGANDYILKPYSAVQLVARVKSLLKPARNQPAQPL